MIPTPGQYPRHNAKWELEFPRNRHECLAALAVQLRIGEGGWSEIAEILREQPAKDSHRLRDRVRRAASDLDIQFRRTPRPGRRDRVMFWLPGAPPDDAGTR